MSVWCVLLYEMENLNWSKLKGDEVVVYVQTLAFKGTIGSTLLLMKDFISDLSDYNTLPLSFTYVFKEA